MSTCTGPFSIYSRPAAARALLFALALLLAALSLVACKKILTPPDPSLRPIQEMLDRQVPIGTSQASVELFLATQGYEQQPPQKPGTLVAMIRKIDLEKVEPVTARVTFYFGANDKLKEYELQRVLNQPLP